MMVIPASTPVMIRPKIGMRRFGKNLCLLNQKRRESWVSGGTSIPMWERLREGDAPIDVAHSLSAKYNVPADKILRDVLQFVENLWQRQIVDVVGLEHVSEAERADLVKDEPHNKSGRVVEAAYRAEVMFRCTFDLLIPCNLRCRHCYLDFSEKDILPFADVCNYFDQLAEHGCPEMSLTGGEIFLRRDLIDIIAHGEQRGFFMDLLTNGNYITRQKADELAKYCLNAVQISIYGTTASVHEAVTMQAGTFDKSMAAARFLIERGVPVRLAYFIQHDNIEDAFRFPEFAESVGANYAFDTKLVPNRNGSKDLLRFGVSMDQMARLYRTGLLKRETSFICTAAVAKSRITACGEVYPCELINTASMGNLKQQSLGEIWSSQRRLKLREAIIGYKPHRCGGCNHVSDCEPCAAMRGFNQENHMEAPVSEACFMTTASLIAHGKTPDKSSFFQNSEDDCVSSILAQNTISASPLVQIMRTRAAGTVM